jgi:hypothetical protein
MNSVFQFFYIAFVNYTGLMKASMLSLLLLLLITYIMVLRVALCSRNSVHVSSRNITFLCSVARPVTDLQLDLLLLIIKFENKLIYKYVFKFKQAQMIEPFLIRLYVRVHVFLLSL